MSVTRQYIQDHLVPIITSVVVLTASLFGQSPYDAATDTGLMPFQTYDGDEIASVNVATGSLYLHIPLVSFPQRGGKLKADFKIMYTSPYTSVTCPYSNVCYWANSSGGYETGTGTVSVGSNAFRTIGTRIAFSCGTACNAVYGTVGEFDGTSHPMGWMSYDGTTGKFRALDGSGYYGTIVNGVGSTVVDREGTTYYCPINENSTNPCTATDTNGNRLTFYNWPQFTDTMGRQIPAMPYSGPWTVPGPNGGTATYQVTPSAVTLPDGTSYVFQFTTINLPLVGRETQAQTFTVLSKIILPSGGSITYGYPSAIVNDSCGSGSNYHLPVTSKSVDANDGTGPHTWTYTRNTSTNVVTITDPLGNYTTHTFSTGLCYPYETQNQSFDNKGTLLKTVNTQFMVTCSPFSAQS